MGPKQSSKNYLILYSSTQKRFGQSVTRRLSLKRESYYNIMISFNRSRSKGRKSTSCVLSFTSEFLAPGLWPTLSAHRGRLRHFLSWSDEACIEILKNLHDAADDKSRLLIVEAVVSHACHDVGSLKDSGVEGAYPTPMPKPLPANGGRAVGFEACFDIHVSRA